MILPFLDGIKSFAKAPITWFLIILNTLICIYTTDAQKKSRYVLDRFFESEALVRAQGEIFADYIAKNSDSYNELFVKMSDMTKLGNTEQRDTLGKVALRDKSFALNALNFETEGDIVQLDFWKEEYKKVRESLDRDPVNKWGLSMNDNSLIKWFSYQFLHGGYFHLISNMWFLLIFGSLLEPMLGSLMFLVVYLISGFFAAGAFVELSGISGIPLVGASGSVSGLMGVIVSYYWTEKVRYMYWVLPLKGYTGFVWLPAWLLLFIWGISDVAGYFGTIRELGGIAHAAHMGGALHGLIIGCFFRVWRKTPSHGVFGHASRL